MNHTDALRVAAHLVDYMGKYCEWISIAGSVRRSVAECGDIEIVAIPKWGGRPDLYSLFHQEEPVNLLCEAMSDSEFIRWIKPGTQEIETWPIKPEGKYWRGLIRGGAFDSPIDIKLDLFLCERENLGVIYAIRTDSADFSREIVTYARDHTPFRVVGGHLMKGDEAVPCPDEETLFACLNLEWVEPMMRRGKSDIRRIAA